MKDKIIMFLIKKIIGIMIYTFHQKVPLLRKLQVIKENKVKETNRYLPSKL